MEEDYQEIDLREYLEVILKRKKTIFFVFLSIVFLAFLFSLTAPKVWRVETSLEIGQIDDKPIEIPEQIVKKIENDVYGTKTKKEKKLSEKSWPKIEAENPKGTNLVNLKIDSSKPQEAKEILESIDEIIIKEHQKKLSQKREMLKENIKAIEKELKLLETKKIYSDQGISQLQTSLLDLKNQLNDLKETRMVKKPVVSEKPVKPKFWLNVSISAVLGLFLAIFLVFFQEWWEKSSPRKEDR